MRTIARVVLAAVATVCLCPLAQAKVHVTVDLDRQTMHVDAGDQTYDWKVSSGKFGYETPPGKYGVLWMDKDHKSQEYDNAPMPDAIFFAPGYAIHGAYKSDFGHPASHGCVRLPVDKAALLFDLVKAQGADVRITGGDASGETIAKARPSRPDEDADGYETAPAGYEAPRVDAYGAPRTDGGYGYYEEAPSPAQQRPINGGSLFGGFY